MFCPECGNHAANKAIRKLEESGQIGRTVSNVFTFDGNPEGKDKINMYYVKISDKIPDMNTFVSLRAIMYGMQRSLTTADCIVKEESGDVGLYWNNNLIAGAVAAENGNPGLYVMCDPDNNSYVYYIEFSETIHPIDQKYIPGPVVLDATAYSESEGGNSVMDYLFSLICGYGGSAVAYTPENGDYDSDEAVEAVKRLVADVPMDRPCMIYLPYVGCYAHITSVIERENLKEISFTLSFSDEKGMRWTNVLINSDAIMSCYTFRAVSYPEPEE